MRNIELEKFKHMHYIEYTPGFTARIVDYPTPFGLADVNILSRTVVNFNNLDLDLEADRDEADESELDDGGYAVPLNPSVKLASMLLPQ